MAKWRSDAIILFLVYGLPEIASKYSAKKSISLFFNQLLPEPSVPPCRNVKYIDGQGGADKPGATGYGDGAPHDTARATGDKAFIPVAVPHRSA